VRLTPISLASLQSPSLVASLLAFASLIAALVKVGSWKCHDYTQLGKIVKGERERLKREFGIGRKNPKKLRFRISSSSSSLYHTVGIRDCILRGLGRTLEEFETEEEKEIGKRHEGEAIVARFNRNVLAIR